MSTKGNNVFSAEEEAIADYLKEKYLDYTNQISEPVHPRKTFYTLFGKRCIDLCIVIPIVVVLSPLYLVLAITNLFNLGRPVIFKQTRFGYKGRYYSILKFRSMKNETDKEGRQLPPEKRLTNYGRFIRRYSLDELPNFFNIVKGEMSIIGPRAVPIFYMERMSNRHRMMSEVRPGLECPRMVDITFDEKISNYHITFENNIWYVENISLKTDLMMVLQLVKMVFSMGERSKHANAASYFAGYDDKGRAISSKFARELYGDLFDRKGF